METLHNWWCLLNMQLRLGVLYEVSCLLMSIEAVGFFLFWLSIQNDFGSIAVEALQLYHSLDPPENQFFIRAYLCEALVLSSSDKEGGFTEVC